MVGIVFKRKSQKRQPSPLERRPIHFTSSLSVDQRHNLEHLLFFNPQQQRYVPKIIDIIDTTGVPKIVQYGDKLRVQIDAENECQTIFALTQTEETEQLVGLVMFIRQTQEKLLILHLVVDEAYSMKGVYASESLTFQLIDQVRNAGAHIKGIKSVGIVYGRTAGATVDLPIKK